MITGEMMNFTGEVAKFTGEILKITSEAEKNTGVCAKITGNILKITGDQEKNVGEIGMQRKADHRPGRRRAALGRQKLHRRLGPVHRLVMRQFR